MSSTAIESPVLTIVPIRTVMGVRFYPQFDGKNFTEGSARGTVLQGGEG